MQEGSQTNRQMYKKTNALTYITYIRYIQTGMQTCKTDRHRQTSIPTDRQQDRLTYKEKAVNVFCEINQVKI
jgi:hypothetical protein